jgi:hypothetical protein
MPPTDQNINTVDIIYPAWPIFMYTNPTLGKYLLNGLLAYQATGQYPNAWAVHDLGGFLHALPTSTKSIGMLLQAPSTLRLLGTISEWVSTQATSSAGH